MKKVNITGSTVTEALNQIDILEGISPKNRGCLRLLAEEMFSMCNELLKKKTLDFVLQQEDNQYTLTVATKARVDEPVREEFLSLSSSGENAANKGVKGVLGAILEAFFYNDEAYIPYGAAWGYEMEMPGMEYSHVWSLSQYMDKMPKEQEKVEWDGMEKSIIANFADDVSIAVRAGKLEMTVTKIF